MAYSELIKNFEKVRDYMREFYVYGFKSRESYTQKSSRSYDDERRRIESWLGEYVSFRQMQNGKNVFLSIDSRASSHNPLYKAWKTKSFTDGDITLHFLLFDILHEPQIKLSLNEIIEQIDERLACFQNPKNFDISTIRKKLKEYMELGLIHSEKNGKAILYSRAKDVELTCTDALHFFSEVAPCGVLGSFLLEKTDSAKNPFAFKHHYITAALDSDILFSIFTAMQQKTFVCLHTFNHKKEAILIHQLAPLRIYISVQSGRQYLMAYRLRDGQISSYRLDKILSVTQEDRCNLFDAYKKELDQMQQHIWGVNTDSKSARLEHVDFTVRYCHDEQHIHHRLEREKRCGIVEKIDATTSRFSADVCNSAELIPWIRTFLCRITEIHFSNAGLENQFKKDIQTMYQLYHLDEGELE